MTDTRPRIDAGRLVDLEAVHAALGHAVCASGAEIVVADEDAPVTVDQLQAAVDAAPDDTSEAEREQRLFVLTQAVPTLRQWATDAEGTTATSTNAVATLNVVIDRLGVFFDRFADLLEDQYGDG